jgi:hypothetical protein
MQIEDCQRTLSRASLTSPRLLHRRRVLGSNDSIERRAKDAPSYSTIPSSKPKRKKKYMIRQTADAIPVERGAAVDKKKESTF